MDCEKLSEKQMLVFNQMVGLLVTDERTRWFLAGLMEGYKIHARRNP